MFQLPGEHGPMYASIGLAPSSGYQDEHHRDDGYRLMTIGRYSSSRSPSKGEFRFELHGEHALGTAFRQSVSSASVRNALTSGVPTSNVVTPDSRQASSRSRMRSRGPTSATSSISASGTAAIASRCFPSR
jgi:hypothetical protein